MKRKGLDQNITWESKCVNCRCPPQSSDSGRGGWLPGSERDRCRGQKRVDTGVREGWTGSERDRHRGQRGMDARVREGWIQESWVVIFVQKRA